MTGPFLALIAAAWLTASALTLAWLLRRGGVL